MISFFIVLPLFLSERDSHQQFTKDQDESALLQSSFSEEKQIEENETGRDHELKTSWNGNKK